MDNQQLSDEQQQALNDKLEAGVAFESLVHSQGYEHLKAYYQNKLSTFVTNMFNSDRPIGEFENERQQLMGLKKLFTEVTSTLEVLKNERQKGQ